MEIGDLFVVNKSDRPGAQQMQRDLEYVLHLRESTVEWHPKVLLTVAHKNQNIDTVRDEIGIHKCFLEEKNRLKDKRSKRLRRRVELLVRSEMEDSFWNKERLDKLAKYLQKDHKQRSPYRLAQEMLEELLKRF